MGLEHEDEIEEVHPKIQACKRVVGNMALNFPNIRISRARHKKG